MVRHFLTLLDLTPEEALGLLDLADRLRGIDARDRLPGRTLGLIFEKPSLRTRVSFEAGMAQLGGSSIFLQGKDVGLGVRESVRDFARVISQYVDMLAVRTFAHSILEELAAHASIPVINALSDSAHPCQAMADLLTVRRVFGRLDDSLSIVFVGDGNNVARSLAVACGLLGPRFTLAAPAAYDFPADFRATFAAAFPGRELRVVHDPTRAAVDADVIYTDVWTSMGQEAESETRRSIFRPYQVDDALFSRANRDAIFLHCLPAHRGEEVTDAVLDGPRSQVVEQAANRMHFQKALLTWLMGRD
ncbi:MAG: ornithine carbamoyltransferase [Isosphaeraceae bacterium]|nr:ornithine carbamoyltransferase [Isosphaeraceae bacterium]